MTFPFLRQYFTREDVKIMQSIHYITCARRLEKSTISDKDRLFLSVFGILSVMRTQLYRWRKVLDWIFCRILLQLL